MGFIIFLIASSDIVLGTVESQVEISEISNSDGNDSKSHSSDNRHIDH